MYFESFADFVAMGRHGAYVWSAYGCALVIVVAHVVAARRLRRRALREAVSTQRLARVANTENTP